jgi:hypothetical protein
VGQVQALGGTDEVDGKNGQQPMLARPASRRAEQEALDLGQHRVGVTDEGKVILRGRTAAHLSGDRRFVDGSARIPSKADHQTAIFLPAGPGQLSRCAWIGSRR